MPALRVTSEPTLGTTLRHLPPQVIPTPRTPAALPPNRSLRAREPKEHPAPDRGVEERVDRKPGPEHAPSLLDRSYSDRSPQVLLLLVGAKCWPPIRPFIESDRMHGRDRLRRCVGNAPRRQSRFTCKLRGSPISERPAEELAKLVDVQNVPIPPTRVFGGYRVVECELALKETA